MSNDYEDLDINNDNDNNDINDNDNNIDIPIYDNNVNNEYQLYDKTYKSFIAIEKYCRKNNLPFLTRSNEMEILFKIISK
jgi:hypothetical protein